MRIQQVNKCKESTHVLENTEGQVSTMKNQAREDECTHQLEGVVGKTSQQTEKGGKTRDTHILQSAEGQIKDIGRMCASKGHSRPGECSARDKLG
jgi:hypothetical protein